MKKYGNFIRIRLLSVSHAVLILILSTSCMTMHHMGMESGVYSQPGVVTLTDPVCGTEVNSEVSFRSDYEGRTFYFDSEECLRVFQKNPEQFASGNTKVSDRDRMYAAATMGGVAMAAMMIVMMFTMVGVH